MKHLKNGLILLFLITLLAGCSLPIKPSEKKIASLLSMPNYKKASSWAAKATKIDKPVDVFYVYPTIYAEKSPKNMDISRPDLQARVDHLIASQASVYSKSANLFAPYYRQMTFAALDDKTDMFKNPYFQIGSGDVLKAFEYYLTHINKDRPFIIAGHSQGSMILIDLMRKHFNNPAWQKRLVAAYLIGYSVTRDDLKKYPWLKAAQKSDDTGVIISYNTQAPGTIGSPVLLPGAICINPLNWTTGSKPADKSLNKGAVFFNGKTNKIEREIRHYAGAQIDLMTGALVTTSPEKLNIGSFPKGVYHKFDYAFWYRNLQANVARRIKAYSKRP